jgi:Fe-S-cluster containining protein
MNQSLRQWVQDAAARPQVGERIAQIYNQLQAEIDHRRPLCVISGRCCRFDEYGHRLYVTTAELAAFVQACRDRPMPPASPVSAGCPFQVGKLCGVHPIRPLGCRIFFCDATAVDWQRDLYERFHGDLKRLHEELAIPYAYVEWRSALADIGFDAFLPGVAKAESF